MKHLLFLVLSAVCIVAAQAGVTCRVEHDYGVRAVGEGQT